MRGRLRTAWVQGNGCGKEAVGVEQAWMRTAWAQRMDAYGGAKKPVGIRADGVGAENGCIWWGEEAGRDTAWVQEKDGNGWGKEAGGNERALMSGRLRQRGCKTMDGDGVGEQGLVRMRELRCAGGRGR
eukprot:s3099_g10.t1